MGDKYSHVVFEKWNSLTPYQWCIFVFKWTCSMRKCISKWKDVQRCYICKKAVFDVVECYNRFDFQFWIFILSQFYQCIYSNLGRKFRQISVVPVALVRSVLVQSSLFNGSSLELLEFIGKESSKILHPIFNQLNGWPTGQFRLLTEICGLF